MQPWLLLFGIAALIPILVHFLHRHSHRRMSWAATHYLALALEQIARRFSFFQLFLLLARIFAVLLLAICLATPILNNQFWFQKSEKLTSLKIIVVDRSFSMQVKEGNQSRFEDAKRIAADVVESAEEGDGFIITTFDSSLRTVVAKPIASKADAQAAISTMVVSNQPSVVGKILPQLIDICTSNQRMFFDTVEVYFVSDFATKDWYFLESEVVAVPSDQERDGEESDADKPLPTAEPVWERLLEVAEVRFKKVISEQRSNNFVSSIKVVQPITIVNAANSVEVQIENRGASGAQDVLMELVVGDKILASKPTQIPPNGRSTLQADFTLGSVGPQMIEARISSDALELDDRRFLKVDVREKYKVAFVEGKPKASKFLQLALDPVLSSNSEFQFKTFSTTSFSSTELQSYDAIFVDNVRRLTASDVRRLYDFVRSGRPVFLFLGDLVDRQNFNRLWSAEPEQSLGIRLVGIQPIDDYQIDPLNYRSPYIRAFRGNPDAGLTSLPIWIYFKTQVVDRAQVDVDLAFTNGDPLLLSKRIGDGNLTIFLSSSSSLSKARDIPGQPNVAWNANETSPGFPALIQELFRVGMQQVGSGNFQIGQAARGQLTARSRVEDGVLLDPTGRNLELTMDQKDGVLTWASEPLQRPGFYSLTASTPGGEFSESFAVNVETNDSDVRTLRPVETNGGKEAGDIGVLHSPPKFYLFQVLLLGLLGVLILESIVALRFGREK